MDISSEIEQHIGVLRALQAPSGLFLAAAGRGVSTGYDKAWLRDNFYVVRAFEECGDWDTSLQTWHALLDIFLKHEDKINRAIEQKPRFTYQYIHARYNADTFEEFWEEWGNKQNDAVGCILFALGDMHEKGVSALRNDDDRRIVGRLVDYLRTVEYWHDLDNGVWEEYEEVHASSIGACVAGLKKIRSCGVSVEDRLIKKGEEALKMLLPRESHTKFTDLALLSLIYPYNVIDEPMRSEILRHLEYHLVRERGVIRYKNDRYYNRNDDGFSEEAEWTMGFPWLSIIYREQGEHERADDWLKRTRDVLTNDTLPELYYSHTNEPNENNPLGWSESLLVIALERARVARGA